MDDREIDFDLIEPTGMDGPVNEHQVGILALEPLDCPGTSMRRTVVDDPENPSRPAIGMLLHDLIDQAIKGAIPVLSRARPALGGNPGSAGAGKVFQASQSFFEEPFSPAADDLAARTEAVGDLVIRKALLSEEDHLGPRHNKIW